MKKFLSFLMLSALVAFTSCTKEDVGATSGEEVLARISVELPSQGTQTRAAFANPALTDMRVVLFVSYNDQLVDTKVLENQSFGQSVNFDLRLVTGKAYKVAVWADFGSSYYTLTNTIGVAPKVEMANTTITGSDNKYDAYFKAETVTFAAAGEVKNFVLKRPFGLVKINTADNDLNTVKNAGLRASKYYTQISAPTELNLLDGSVSDVQTVTIGWSSVSEAVGDGSPKELSFDYLFAGESQSPIADFTVSYKNASNADICSYEFTNIPIRRNYITNILGNVLTKGGIISVTVNPIWEGTITEEIQEVSSIDELQAVITASSSDSNGVNVSVTGEVTGNNTIIIPDLVQAANTPVISMSFADMASGAKLIIKDETPGVATNNYNGKIYITVPSGTNASDIEINTSKAHVTVYGSYGEIIATTSPSTLVVDKDATVAKITVVAGNVDIYGRVAEIVRDASNVDALTYVNVYAPNGVLTTMPSDQKIIVNTITAGLIVNKTTGRSYATVKDAVKAAANGDVIELSAGEYPLTATEAIKQNNDYFLNIDKSITLRGVGEVLVYGATEGIANGAYNTQSLVFVKAPDVKIENITFMPIPRATPNKTIEVLESGIVIDKCKFVPNTKMASGSAIFGGSVYFNNAQMSGTVKNSSFKNVVISFDGVLSGAILIENNKFDGVYNNDYPIFTTPNWGNRDVANSTAVVTLKTNTFVNVPEFTSTMTYPLVFVKFGKFNLQANNFPTNGIYWKAYDTAEINVNGVVFMADILNVTKAKSYQTINDAIKDAADKNEIRLSAKTFDECISVAPAYVNEVKITGMSGTKVKSAVLYGGKFTFENVEFYGKSTYSDGTTVVVGGDAEFKNCSFNITEANPGQSQYRPLQTTYSFAKSIVLDGCTFNTNGKASNAYLNPMAATGSTKVSNCTFVDKGLAADIVVDAVKAPVFPVITGTNFNGTSVGFGAYTTSVEALDFDTKVYCNQILANNTFSGANKVSVSKLPWDGTKWYVNEPFALAAGTIIYQNALTANVGDWTNATLSNGATVVTSGAFSRSGRYRQAWMGNWSQSVEIYVDAANMADGEYICITSSPEKAVGGHIQDFVFGFLKNNGKVLVKVENNTSGANVLSTYTDGRKIAELTTSGWYTLKWSFVDASNVWTAIPSLLDAAGTTLGSKTMSVSGSALSINQAGMNRYIWLTNAEVTNHTPNPPATKSVNIRNQKLIFD